MRRFELWQDELRNDPPRSVRTSVGRVAEGIEFSDGTVAIRWCAERAATAVWASAADAVSVHERVGTRLVWVDA